MKLWPVALLLGTAAAFGTSPESIESRASTAEWDAMWSADNIDPALTAIPFPGTPPIYVDADLGESPTIDDLFRYIEGKWPLLQAAGKGKKVKWFNSLSGDLKSRIAQKLLQNSDLFWPEWFTLDPRMSRSSKEWLVDHVSATTKDCISSTGRTCFSTSVLGRVWMDLFTEATRGMGHSQRELFTLNLERFRG